MRRWKKETDIDSEVFVEDRSHIERDGEREKCRVGRGQGERTIKSCTFEREGERGNKGFLDFLPAVNNVPIIRYSNENNTLAQIDGFKILKYRSHTQPNLNMRRVSKVIFQRNGIWPQCEIRIGRNIVFFQLSICKLFRYFFVCTCILKIIQNCRFYFNAFEFEFFP